MDSHVISSITSPPKPGTEMGLGLGYAVVSTASFSLSGPLAHGLMAAGWSSAAATVVRVLTAGLVLLPIALVQLRGRWNLLRRNARLLTHYGLFAVAGVQLTYFNAVSHMEVAVALLIQNTAPIAVTGWLWSRHRQRPPGMTVVGAALGLAGLPLVVGLHSEAGIGWVGIGWALASMLGGVAFVLLSSRTDTALPGTVLATSGLLIGGLILLAAGIVGIVPLRATANSIAFQDFTVPWWPPALVLGTVTAALAYVSGIAATRLLGPRLAAFAALLEVLTGLVFAWYLLGETPRPIQLLGGLLILIGVVIVRRGETLRVA